MTYDSAKWASILGARPNTRIEALYATAEET